jgi:hypothetical protein
MKILLDESAPQKLRLLIEDHVVVTVAYQGWSGLKNGTLLTIAEDAGYDLVITADQEIAYQQNLTGRKLALLVLSTNNWDYVKAAFDRIRTAIASVTTGSYTEVKIPE